MNPVALFFAKFKLYFIFAGIVVLVGTTAYLMWSYKDAVAERDKNKAVAEYAEQAQARIDAAERLAAHYRELSDKKYTLLMDKLSKIKVERTVITNNIREEIATNTEFYSQPLPPKGWDQWIKARALYPTVPAPLEK